MGHPETDLSQITVPPEDEAIPRAFAELESNINAWSSAISDAHRKLERMIEQARMQQAEADLAAGKAKEAQTAAQAAATQVQAKDTGAPPRQKSKATTPAPAAQSAKAALKEPAKTAETTSAGKAPPKYTREMAQSDTQESNKKRGKAGKGLVGRIKRKNAGDGDADKTAKGANVANANSDDPDEALLATLDEKTAQAIRIKRRLLNKSVRELLDEMK